MTFYKCGSVYTTQNSNVVVDTASGAVANFQTPLAMPLLKTRFDFKATQEAGTPTPDNPKAISGVSAVNIYHRGANLFDISTKTNDKALKWTDGDTFNDAKSIVSDYIEVKEGIRFTSNYLAQWCCYDKDKNYLGNILSGSLVKTSGSDRVDNTIPSGYGVYYLRLGYRSSQNNNEDMTEKTDIMLNIGNTAIPFEPYNGSTTLINLGGTYYGGYVSQDKDGKRELVVTHNVKLFSELDFRRSNSGGSWSSYVFFAQMSDKTNKSAVKCSNYNYVTQSIVSMLNETITSGSSNEYIYIRDDNYTTVEAFKTANANTQVWYELAEPFTVALPDGQPIKSLPGVNNIFADTGDTSLQFRKIG